MLRRAAALGVDHIDTAQFYGAGRANALIRKALYPYPAELVLATKVRRAHRGQPRQRASPYTVSFTV